MGLFYWIAAAVIVVIGLAMVAFPQAFTKEPDSILVSLNPIILLMGIGSFILGMILSQFPKRAGQVIVRSAGGIVVLIGLGVGVFGTHPNLFARSPEEPAAPPQAAMAPPPQSVPSQAPALTEADADTLIAQASAAWRSGDIPGAIRNAEQAREIRVALLGGEHPNVAEVDRMLTTARAQSVGN